jgi:hypothetical protein
MSKISIVFDRLRTEEKMLQKAAAELGHTAKRKREKNANSQE